MKYCWFHFFFCYYFREYMDVSASYIIYGAIFVISVIKIIEFKYWKFKTQLYKLKEYCFPPNGHFHIINFEINYNRPEYYIDSSSYPTR